MQLLVEFDLSNADIELFNAYEATVLALLAKQGARLTARVRSIDGTREVHLLNFPDASALARFRNDPERMAAQPLWAKCGAMSHVTEVDDVL